MDIMGELLASQSKKIITLNRGQQAEGTIVSITEKEITLDLGSKSEGVLQRREVETQELKLGDQLKVFISQTENRRMRALIKFDSGFDLAAKDLEIRGPGDFSGQRQWGVPDIAMEALKDISLVEETRKEAAERLLCH